MDNYHFLSALQYFVTMVKIFAITEHTAWQNALRSYCSNSQNIPPKLLTYVKFNVQESFSQHFIVLNHSSNIDFIINLH